MVLGMSKHLVLSMRGKHSQKPWQVRDMSLEEIVAIEKAIGRCREVGMRRVGVFGTAGTSRRRGPSI